MNQQFNILSTSGFGTLHITLAIWIILAWTLIWKGLALWRAGKNGQRNWFIAILLINSLGILEMVYLFRFAKKPLTIKEIKGWFGR